MIYKILAINVPDAENDTNQIYLKQFNTTDELDRETIKIENLIMNIIKFRNICHSYKYLHLTLFNAILNEYVIENQTEVFQENQIEISPNLKNIKLRKKIRNNLQTNEILYLTEISSFSQMIGRIYQDMISKHYTDPNSPQYNISCLSNIYKIYIFRTLSERTLIDSIPEEYLMYVDNSNYDTLITILKIRLELLLEKYIEIM